VRGLVTMVERRGHEVVVHLETGAAPTPHLLSQLELPDAPGELAGASVDVASLHPNGPDAAHALLRKLGRIVPHQRRPDEDERSFARPAPAPAVDAGREPLGDLSMRLPAAQAPRLGDTIGVAVDADRLF